jgi:hypothetical protein
MNLPALVFGLPLLVVVVALVCVLLGGILYFVFLSRRRNRRRRVLATITQIQMEASTLESGWVVTAQWFDPSNGQTAIFRSRRLVLRPKKQIGDSIIVLINPSNPRHYHMEL